LLIDVGGFEPRASQPIDGPVHIRGGVCRLNGWNNAVFAE